jgi:tellurite resistance protein TerC
MSDKHLELTEKEQYAANLKHSIKWVLIWVALAACCNVIIGLTMGKQLALEFTAGYLIELSLSVDNLFVFMTIFLGFGIKDKAQHRVLGYGIMGAVILRFIFIFFGTYFNDFG